MTAIVVVVDISEKTDDFLKSNLSPWRIFTDYYLGFIPRIDAMLFPLFTFISVIFFTSKMAGRSEVIAIISSGVTFRRFLQPYWIGGLFLTLILWIAYLIVIPQANRKWSAFEQKYVDVNSVILSYSNSAYKQNVYFKDDPETYISIRGYDTVSKSGNGLSVNRLSGNKLKYNLRAENFSWDSASRRWKMFNITERWLDTISENVVKKAEGKGSFHFRPSALCRSNYIKDQMTTSELSALIRLEKQRGSELINTLLIERHSRDAIPVSVLILTLIGAIIASKKTRGGSGAHLALGVLISMLYVFASRVTLVFATKGNLYPMLAAWLPNILFGAMALYLYRRAIR